MRVWDIHPGYLNRQSLLGEHSEIHALASILKGGKGGFAHHPETVRWRDHLGALRLRHEMGVAEMRLRGYDHQSPLEPEPLPVWPETFVDPPGRQFAILRGKYGDGEPGRIPLPRTSQQLWAQHKYSILARDLGQYHALGSRLAAGDDGLPFEALALELTWLLRQPPSPGGVRNALEHMWGYVNRGADPFPSDLGEPRVLLGVIQELAMQQRVCYLLESTALSDLVVWLPRGKDEAALTGAGNQASP